MKIEWVGGSEISVRVSGDKEITVSANREGLLSLAGQRKALAEGMPGDHIHYDDYSSLEEGSADMVIERI